MRQLDTSVLCQLWSLNEAVQELKQSMLLHGDRLSETNSTCSSRSLDQGLDGIVEEESDYEPPIFHVAATRLYENIDIVSGMPKLVVPGMGGVKRGRKTSDGEEGDYLEPQSWREDAVAAKPLSPVGEVRIPPPNWNLPPQLSLELLSLPPPPPLPLSSPPHSPPIPSSPVYLPVTTSASGTSSSSTSLRSSISSASNSSSCSVKGVGGKSPSSPQDRSPRENKWPGYLLLNTSTTYESTC